ncbi:hypothetical protein [uncultured Campylobacter sp.]|uniref:hypothetical protein n=1 Tax=uncultured Campylobacter sp. TaxID=218934 RepID=UPI00261653C5|nr:hypothetical protein [uncultured Campylobacter sp.]
MQNEKEFTQICKEILALSEKVKELNLSRLETISVEIKLAKNSFDDKSGEMDAKIAEFNAVAQRLEPLKQSLAKAEEILAKIKENGGAGVSEEKAKQLINEAVSELASAVEELKQKTPIDDAAAAVDKTYSSKKIEDTFLKKGESVSSGVDEAKVNELIDAKAANLANKDELADKLSTTIYEEDKKTLATKLDVTNAVSNKIDTTTLNSAIGGLATAFENKISTLAAAAVTQTALNKYTKAQNIASNTIDFMQGVNFTGSVSGQITAGSREAGQSGLVYISGNGVSGFSSDFVILNPSEATYGQGYVFFSYFVRPGDNKVLISFIKAA